MSPVAETLALIAAAVLMPMLVNSKWDQQSISMLEGRLSRLGGDTALAAGIYRKHRRRTPYGLTLVGFVLIAAAIYLYRAGHPLFPAPGLLGASLIGAGIWGLSRSFIAAAREVDELSAS